MRNPEYLERSVAGIARRLKRDVDFEFTCIHKECREQFSKRRDLAHHLLQHRKHMYSIKQIKAAKKKLDRMENPTPKHKLALASKVVLLIHVNPSREDEIWSIFGDESSECTE